MINNSNNNYTAKGYQSSIEEMRKPVPAYLGTSDISVKVPQLRYVTVACLKFRTGTLNFLITQKGLSCSLKRALTRL